MKTYASREAKNHFGSMLDDAQREPVTITRKGRPVAIVLSLEEYNESTGGIQARFSRTIEKLRQEAEDNGLTDDVLDQILNEK